jgi:hypothetical protein
MFTHIHMGKNTRYSDIERVAAEFGSSATTCDPLGANDKFWEGTRMMDVKRPGSTRLCDV